jgi:LysM repeat protein
MKAHVCPHLGLKDDPDTAFAYASPANHCFQPASPTAIKLDHQRRFCLSGRHPACEVFRSEPGQSPKDLKTVTRRSRREPIKIRSLLLWIFPTLIVLAGIIAVVHFLPGMFSPIPTLVSTQASTNIVMENTITPLATTAIPSVTITLPSITPTLVVVHALDVPIGTLTPLVIHRVKGGESLPLMARSYNTTEEAIKAINYNLTMPLWPNMVIVIPMNQADVRDLPFFEPYLIVENITPQALAERLTVDVVMLREYNLVSPETVLMIGEWVLIPHARQATPTE